MKRSTRLPKPPPERDREIFGCVRINGHSQESVGRKHGLTQARVSQIVKRVAAWYAEHSPGMLDLADDAARQRLALAEYRLRLDMAFHKAHVAFEDSARPLVTKRTKTTTTTTSGGEVSRVEVVETVERDQRRDTRAVVEMGKLARGIWEAAVGSACRAEPRSDAQGEPSPQGSSRQEEPTVESAYERQKRHGCEWALRRLELVRDGILSLEDAERCIYECAKSDGYIYESYYETTPGGITFRVAPWVREFLPRDRVPGPERQPTYTVHDIADWDAWCGGSPAVWDPVDAACVARWEAWTRSREAGVGSWEGGAWEGEAPVEARSRLTEKLGTEKWEEEVAPSNRPDFPVAHFPVIGPERATSAAPGSSRQVEPTALERRLASERRMPERERRRLNPLAARRRESIARLTPAADQHKLP